MKAKNDKLIDRLLADSRFMVKLDGSISTLRKGKWQTAGRLDKEGYREVWYDGKRLKAHRIVYRKFKGELDRSKVVDHINRNTSDNRPSNLQLVTMQDNNFYRFRRAERNAYGKRQAA